MDYFEINFMFIPVPLRFCHECIHSTVSLSGCLLALLLHLLVLSSMGNIPLNTGGAVML